MVDASVGGKTGIDFNGIKNHIGTITSPKGVFVNTNFLTSLTERHIKNGYAEIIKIAIISDATFWNELKKNTKTSQFCTQKIITKAIELKNGIVKKDVTEKNIRQSLNFGHTIGHALESSLLKQQQHVLHGEAVAFGLIIESKLALQQTLLTKKQCDEIVNYINAIFPKQKLSVKTKQLLFEYLKHDKKNNNGAIGFALPQSIGSFKLSFNITVNNIKDALN
jgi:3-dehydroquinate synthase